MHAIVDAKEEVYHTNILVKNCRLCNFYFRDTNCELHPESYFYYFYGCIQWAIEVFLFAMLLYCTLHFCLPHQKHVQEKKK